MWNFYKLESVEKQFQVKTCILKNLVTKSTKTMKGDDEQSWDLFFGSPGTAALWGFWVSLGADTEIAIMKQSRDIMPGSVVRTKTPMSDYCKIPADCVWESTSHILGQISFTVDMQTSWTNWVERIKAKSKMALIFDLERDIHIAERGPVALPSSWLKSSFRLLLSVGPPGELDSLKRRKMKLSRELSEVERADMGGEGEEAAGCSSSNSGE